MKKLLYFAFLIPFFSCESSPEQDLVDAIEAEDKTKIQELLDSGADPNADASGVMGEGTTATFEAACTGDVEILEILIGAGGKADFTMEFGTKKVRLFNKLAFKIGHEIAGCDLTNEEADEYIAMVDRCVELGADIGGEQVVDLMEMDMHFETEYDRRNAIIEVAASSSIGISDIDEDCIPQMRKMLEAFLKHGCSLDDYDAWAGTPLIYHAKRRNINMVRLLVELGADINQIGGDMSASPLWYALHTEQMMSNSGEITYDQLFDNDNEVTDYLQSKGAQEQCSVCY